MNLDLTEFFTQEDPRVTDADSETESCWHPKVPRALLASASPEGSQPPPPSSAPSRSRFHMGDFLRHAHPAWSARAGGIAAVALPRSGHPLSRPQRRTPVFSLLLELPSVPALLASFTPRLFSVSVWSSFLSW